MLEGPPGTGKTYVAQRIADTWEGVTGRELGADARGAAAITLHPSTSYEDFIEGLRPRTSTSTDQLDGDVEVQWEGDGHFFFDRQEETENENAGGFGVRDGFFLRACQRAVREPNRDHVVLLDEFNRANTPKVLGDLLTALERTKRGRWDTDANEWDLSEAQVISLPYSGRLFFVPSNVYVLATMNTSDRSVAPLDAALRRRFAFARIEPMPADDLLSELGTAAAKTLSEAVYTWDRLNREVLVPCLGADAALGHSYFFDLAEAVEEGSDVSASEAGGRVISALEEGEIGSLPIRRAFWITPSKTGGSGNQFDLSHTSTERPEWGMVHLFQGVEVEPDRSVEWDFDLMYDGTRYSGNKVAMPQGGKNPNGTWRAYLNGVSGSGKSLTPTARSEFGDAVWVLFEIEDRVFVIEPIDKKEVGILLDRGDTFSIKSGRQFGRLRVGTEVGDQVLDLWERELLPQVFEAVTSAGAEDLVVEGGRGGWLGSYADDLPEGAAGEAEATLDMFDRYLAGLGLKIEVTGLGLGRVPRVVRVDSVAPEEEDVSENEAEEVGAVSEPEEAAVAVVPPEASVPDPEPADGDADGV